MQTGFDVSRYRVYVITSLLEVTGALGSLNGDYSPRSLGRIERPALITSMWS